MITCLLWLFCISRFSALSLVLPSLQLSLGSILLSTAVAAADQAVPVTGLCLWPPLAQKTFTHPFLSSSDLVYSLSFFFRVYSKTYSILSFSFNCSKNEAVIPSIKSFDPDIQWFYENNKCKSTVAPRCVVRPVHFCWAPNTSSI